MSESTQALAGALDRSVLRRSAGWFLGLGVLLVVLGTIGIGRAALLTLASVLFFGWLLIIGGAVQALHAFWRKAWSGFLVELLSGILYTVVGFMIVAHPEAGAVGLTLLIAAFLLVSGVFRIACALAQRFPHWGWVLVHGVISLALGLGIWLRWPVSGLWVIGLFVGIEMLFNGWALIMLGLAARRLPDEGTPGPA